MNQRLSSESPAAAGGDEHETDEPRRRLWRSRRGLFTLVGGALLLYYAVVVATGIGREERDVELDAMPRADSRSHVGLVATVTDVKASESIVKLDIEVVPHGRYADPDEERQLSEPVTLTVDSIGRPPVNFEFPARQPPPAVGAVAGLTSKPFRYPFDKSAGQVTLSMRSAEGDDVPVVVEMADSASDWLVSAEAVATPEGLTLDLSAHRAFLVVCLAVFALCAIAVAGIISVAVIGASLTDGEVVFSEVIWLGAMLVAIPAMRNSMPGIPPIGTALDIFVFLPAVGVVAVSLVASTFVLASTRGATTTMVQDNSDSSGGDDKEWDEGWDSPDATWESTVSDDSTDPGSASGAKA